MRTLNRPAALLSFFAIILCSCSIGLARTDSVNVEITKLRYLDNPHFASGRLLLGFDLPDSIVNSEIFFAEMLIPVTSHIPDSTVLHIFSYAMQIPWSQETSWDDLGDSLGAEVITNEGTSFATSNSGEQLSRFDITDIVIGWHEGRLPNNGLILFCAPRANPYFTYRHDPEGSVPAVKIFYRR